MVLIGRLPGRELVAYEKVEFQDFSVFFFLEIFFLRSKPLFSKKNDMKKTHLF
jgi:hypothetical protein